MNIKTILFISFLFFLTAYSCASREEKVELIKQEVEVIKNKTDKAQMLTGVFVQGENRSNFRAYFDDNDLIYIYEDLAKGYWSGVTNLYFFKDDELIYLSQKEVGFEGPDSKTKRSVEVEIYFDGENVLESSKKLKGQFVDIPREEINEILSHTKKLIEVAKALNSDMN
ncbi:MULTISPECIES: hypothetical protein [Ignavibacterium]|jgi:hypothetical protein|uniref:hypothetical protein n=1 Tax=Ignavibacterium TaxID=795750 RepID=UPI0025B91141|nr:MULTISPECIES: hypothetical protein [Ignavibacterium]MBI5662052.1 hypothetical protein [Ignavibacterium album]